MLCLIKGENDFKCAFMWFLDVFCNIRCCMCCNWHDWRLLWSRRLPAFLCFCSPFPVMTMKSKDVTKEHGHTRYRNLSLPPSGVAHGVSSWVELRKICSLILKQESHKSTCTAATTQQVLPELFRVLLISSSSLSSTLLLLPLCHLERIDMTEREMMVARLPL